jgi:nucleoside-diphosphate-sugar epimerase
MAFGGDFSDPDSMARRDCAAIEALGKALVGSGKPLVITSGTLVMAPGHIGTEQGAPDPGSLGKQRVPGEKACLAFASQGVRAIVLRLAPTVHGPGDYGFMPFLISAARRTGVSAYIADGANRWPAVHRQDAATLFRLAVEKAPAGSVLHGAGESAITFETISHLVGNMLNIPVVSITPEEAVGHFQTPSLQWLLRPIHPSPALTPGSFWAGSQPMQRCLRTWRRAITSPLSLLRPSTKKSTRNLKEPESRCVEHKAVGMPDIAFMVCLANKIPG